MRVKTKIEFIALAGSKNKITPPQLLYQVTLDISATWINTDIDFIALAGSKNNITHPNLHTNRNLREA